MPGESGFSGGEVLTFGADLGKRGLAGVLPTGLAGLAHIFWSIQLRFGRVLRLLGAVGLEDLEGKVLEFAEQGAEFFALSNSGW
jgi:hypothetical protein